ASLLPDRADAVDEFLFVTHQGSCELFGSALAVLLRAAGIPARLVTGYTTGSYNVFTGYYDVRNSDAHAWVEMFQPGAGWIEMEATPGFVPSSDTVGRPVGQWLAADAASWVLGMFVRVVQRLPLGRMGGGAGDAGVLVSATLVVGVLGGLRLRRRLHGSRGIVERACADMLHTLARRGLRRHAAMTPSEVAASLPVLVRPVAAGTMRRFASCGDARAASRSAGGIRWWRPRAEDSSPACGFGLPRREHGSRWRRRPSSRSCWSWCSSSISTTRLCLTPLPTLDWSPGCCSPFHR